MKAKRTSSAFFQLCDDDLHEIARERRGRRLTTAELQTAIHYFENGIEWQEVAAIAVDLAIEDHGARQSPNSGILAA